VPAYHALLSAIPLLLCGWRLLRYSPLLGTLPTDVWSLGAPLEAAPPTAEDEGDELPPVGIGTADPGATNEGVGGEPPSEARMSDGTEGEPDPDHGPQTHHGLRQPDECPTKRARVDLTMHRAGDRYLFAHFDFFCLDLFSLSTCSSALYSDTR